MIMVIQSNNDVTSSSLARQKASSAGIAGNQASKQSDQSPAVPAKQPEVQLSAEAKSIERLEGKIAASEGIDTAKIAQIKQQIADGSYEINNSAIADGLLQRDNML